VIVQTEADIEELRNACLFSPYVAVDTETNFTDQHHKRFLVGISICTAKEELFYIPVGHQMDGVLPFGNLQANVPNWVGIMEQIKCPEWIFHNAKFDLTVLELAGFKCQPEQIWDTLIMSHLIDENPPHGLKQLGKILLKMEEAPELAKQIRSLSKLYGWEGIHPAAMAMYAEQDALMTMRLFHFLLPLLRGQDLFEVYSVDIRYMEFLRQIELRGVLLNQEKARQRSKESVSRMAQIRHEVGFEPNRLILLRDKLYGPPPEGLGLVPSSRTPSGKIQINEAVLEGINHPLAGLVLEYRGLTKATSTWYDGFLQKTDLAGRLHPTFNQTGTVTGRLSCSNPNLQQIPREFDRVKSLFMAPEGFELWEFDFSQIELRLAAVYAQEESLLEAFRTGKDIHQQVADELGISRYAAKTINFAILYGAGVRKLAEQLGTSVQKAFGFLDNYKKTYPKLTQVALQANNAAEQNHYVKMWTGRRRHFRFPSEHHKAFNSVIQGGAFEIVKRAGLNLWDSDYQVVNQVHDSYWLELPAHVTSAEVEYICELMSEWTIEMFELEFVVDPKRLYG